MVGRWGQARWLPHAEIPDGRISFISPKAEEGRADTDMIFEGRRSGEELAGAALGRADPAFRWQRHRRWIAGNTAAQAWRTADGTPGITGGALDSREASPGPIVLQGSDAGHVAYRNIIVTPDISAASVR
jgi:hypothetical protein